MDRPPARGPYRTPALAAPPPAASGSGSWPARWIALTWVVVMLFVGDEPCVAILAIVTTLLAACAPSQSVGCELEGLMQFTPAATPPRRVLVVEDDAQVRAGLRDLLEYEGYLVATAANGAEALRALERAGAPDVILLDLEMPVMTGWQFCERAGADPTLAIIPVVVISAAPLGAPTAPPVVARLDKPIDVGELLALLDRCARPAPRGLRERCTTNHGE